MPDETNRHLLYCARMFMVDLLLVVMFDGQDFRVAVSAINLL